ncbi:breast cancer type 2 susceptibility protein isoform X2 [Anabas testudineus]|uniref:breast cancer type 2 susceptibility protein isoform X2 n=1 Tax=Anabas testudineus TaxID=64144 RepID=UPI000E45CAFD|nr:breast cancer type 2 susceptibility protein isoform X2 [Anabas testudineus]
MLIPCPQSRNSGFQAASGKPVAPSAEALQKAKALFSDISVDIPVVSDTRKSESCGFENINTKPKHNEDTLLPQNGGFQTASGKGVVISTAALKKAKSLLNDVEAVEDNISEKPAQSKMLIPCPQSRNSGFQAASGKPVAPSAEALQKAKALFSDISVDIPGVSDTRKSESCGFENINTKPKHNEDTLLPQNGGFQTASGKGVVISTAALKKAKSLLNDVEAVEDKISEKPAQSKMLIPCPQSRNSGFQAASGKPVEPSAEALQKAKALFSDISVDIPVVSDTRKSESCGFENINTKPKHNEDTLLPQNGGFQTASGKGVAISPAALKKAKTLLGKCEEGNDKISVNPTYSNIPVPGPKSGNSRFHAASGKPVALSAEALQKAKALFSDISFSGEIPDTRNSVETQDCGEKIHCGFMTAGGATVHVSQSNLLKAKNLLKEFDEGPVSANVTQADTNVHPEFKHAEFENVHVGPVVNHENVLHPDNVEINKGAYKNTPTSTNAPSASSRENPSVMTRPLSSQMCPTLRNIGSSAFNEFSSSGEFCSAREPGNNVSVPDEVMTKANSLLNESAALKSKNKKETSPLQNCGFQTASGKGVAISSTALKKAKTLLSECEVSDKAGVKTAHFKMPGPSPPPKEIHFGFTTAGGAKVNVSQQSLLKANNLLKEFAVGDCHDSNSHSTIPHDTSKSDLAKLKDAKTTSNLNLTNSSVKDLSDKESVSQVLQSFPSLQKTDHANETLRIQDSSAHDFISMKDEAPTVFHRKEGKMSTSAVDNWHDTPLEEMKSVLDYEKSKSSFNDGTKSKRTEDSSFLLLQSLDLRGCTETQQMFFAQEALDCTKALLEDEGLAEQNLSGTLENVPQQDCQKSSKRPVKEQKERGKRPGEDLDMTGQPPLKRRLLEEFDRTVDGPRGSTLHPEKSCPKGIMNDRSVFKYSDSLHANITKPHRSGTNYVQNGLQKAIPKQNSTPGDTRPARGKMPAFAPPFHKNTKIQTLKNTVVSDNIKTPLFIPPFKKQRTIVQESSSKAQQEALHPNSFVTPANSNTYVPLTKQSESTKDSTGNKSKNDIQTVTLADTTNDNLMTNQKLPIGCEPEDSITEALGAEDTVSRNQDMFQNLENVEFARDMQDMRIRKKKRQTIRPLPGSLFLTKTSGLSRISLKAAVNGKPPARYTQKQLYGYGVQQYVSEITSETAEKFRFSLQQFLKHEAFKDCGGVQLADGGWLITSNDGTAGKEEFYRALCDTPGVDPKLISEEWVYNHYRWIVWKQASMERSFPETMGSLCLTPEQVLLQLKYRYDVEVDHSQRPALRKIMERDDAAAKTLVLCVCGIVSMGHSPNKRSRSDTKTPQGANTKVENQSAVVWLTDGWYAIKAQLDEPLTAMLHKGRLAVGGKLIIHGAQLVGSQDACSPLEAPESLMLKICANSTRPARWDTKLGFYRDPRPFLLPVSCLYSNGGPVGCVDIIILRSYPIQWMERKSDGGIVFRSVRAEEKEARRYNSLQQKAMETLFAKIQAEFEREEKVINKPRHRRRTTNHRDIASLQDGEELYEAMGDDPAYLEAHLSERQLETLRTYRCSLMEKKQAELQDRYRRALEAEDSGGSCLKRDVTPVWRLCIADSIDQPSIYQLNLWRPSSDLQTLLKEGCRYKVFNLSTSDGKKRSGIETIQLTGTKKTQFQDLQTSQEWLSARFQPRESTSFVDLQNTEFQPLCGEVDLTGYVISVIDAQGSSPAFYLVDGKLNFVKVRCFSSLSQSGLEDVVKSRVFLALSNLHLRGQSTSPTPVVYAGDLTVFSTNPKEGHLQESLSQLRSLVQGFENFYQAAEEKLSHLIKSNGLSSISSPALQPRTPRQDTKSVLSQQPVRGRGFSTPVSRNVPATTSSMEKDPRSLKRRRALDYLSRIPSPPGLSCLSSMASPCVNKTFNPPRRSGTTSTLKTVQTPVYKPVTSPVDDEWVNDEELAMIDTQALCDGVVNT